MHNTEKLEFGWIGVPYDNLTFPRTNANPNWVLELILG